MCRWFAYISPSEPCLLEDVLVTPAHSLSKQVHESYLPKLFAYNEKHEKIDPAATRKEILSRNHFFNIDGLGTVWYSDIRSEFVSPNDVNYGAYPIQYRTLSHPLSDPNFLSVCANTSAKTLFGHIRAAPPSELDPIPTLSTTNCHPFCKGRFSFMHNGTVSHYHTMRKEFIALTGEDEAGWIKGNTDSEGLAAVFFTHLGQETGLGPKAVHQPITDVQLLKKVLVRTLTAVLDAQKKNRADKGKEEIVEPSSINLAITDGRVLLCCRFRNHANEQPPSLYYSTTAGPTLNRKYPGHPDGEHHTFLDPTTSRVHKGHGGQQHGPHVIVASEPITHKPEEWNLVEKNTCVMVGTDGKIAIEPLGISY
ncbi:hypothetical protein M422DRAFT_65558 [Sphaerobolus stellatus SS14]|nr:hypothetical protein M422DRAFT_65558 [Sphaerobolus stellatus SS14]